MIKAALFDLDGTLIDTEDQYTVIWGKICRKYRPDIPRLEYLIKGTTLVQIFERYFPNKADQVEIDQFLDKSEAEMDYSFYPGALAFIEDLKKKRCEMCYCNFVKSEENGFCTKSNSKF